MFASNHRKSCAKPQFINFDTHLCVPRKQILDHLTSHHQQKNLSFLSNFLRNLAGYPIIWPTENPVDITVEDEKAFYHVTKPYPADWLPPGFVCQHLYVGIGVYAPPVIHESNFTYGSTERNTENRAHIMELSFAYHTKQGPVIFEPERTQAFNLFKIRGNIEDDQPSLNEFLRQISLTFFYLQRGIIPAKGPIIQNLHSSLALRRFNLLNEQHDRTICLRM